MAEDRWRPGKDLVNNMLRRFRTLCRRAGVGRCTIHDLHRPCITNWAERLPIHVVQQLAGHSNIETTQQFYLSVQPEDLAEAQAAQSEVIGPIPAATPTDPRLTHLAQNGLFRVGGHLRPERKPQNDKGLRHYARQDSNL